MKSIPRVLAGAAMLVAGFATMPASAREHAIGLYYFSGASGYAPNAGVITDRRGTIFGTASIGGNGSCLGGAGCGTVYALTPAGNKTWNFSVLYNFQGGQDGGAPWAQLTLGPKGSLFGYDADGTYGTVFELLPPAKGETSWTFNILYVFSSKADGNLESVYSPLVWYNGVLYGIASGGSSRCGQQNPGCGSVFELAPPRSGFGSWTETTLFNFKGGATGGEPTSIVESNGNLYVSTGNGHGAVVELALVNGIWTEAVLTKFKGGSDGTYPTNLVAAADGTLYGLAYKGAAGLAFALSQSGGTWTRTAIADIKDHGYGPNSLAAGPNGSLIGSVWGDVDFYPGSVFQLTPENGGSWTLSVLCNFKRGPDRNPVNVVTGRGRHLFGVLNGGDSGFGALFEVR